MNNASIIIPARFSSTRFPGKPLIKILGLEMVVRVAKICEKVVGKANVYVATDNHKIKKICENYDFKVIMTNSDCPTGTDRVYLASKKIKSKIVINVQGDEPAIKANDIKKIIKAKMKNSDKVICGYSLINFNDAKNSNIPKVVTNKKNELLYMSRSLIPGSKTKNTKQIFLKQVCIYAFNKEQLKKFFNFKKKSKNEITEDIEILRFLELNIPIKMIEVSGNSLSVDEKKDVCKVEAILKK